MLHYRRKSLFIEEREKKLWPLVGRVFNNHLSDQMIWFMLLGLWGDARPLYPPGCFTSTLSSCPHMESLKLELQSFFFLYLARVIGGYNRSYLLFMNLLQCSHDSVMCRSSCVLPCWYTLLWKLHLWYIALFHTIQLICSGCWLSQHLLCLSPLPILRMEHNLDYQHKYSSVMPSSATLFPYFVLVWCNKRWYWLSMS